MKMEKLIIINVIVLCLAFSFVFCNKKAEVCNMKCSQNFTLNCTDLKSTRQGRCCVSMDKGNITGIDLINCGITEVNDTFQNLRKLRQLYLQDNPLKKNLTRDNLANVTHLELLSLPPNMECPGGMEAWKEITNTGLQRHCISERDTCNFNNVTCPNTNAECVNSGPGMTSCLCLPGYHGYKCLRKGDFPVEIYGISLCGSTVVLCVLLWCTQRRNAKKEN